MPRRKLKGLRIVVSGGSSGIGRALVEQLADRGASVLATARREDRLLETINRFENREQRSVEGGSIQQLAGDITDPDFRERLVAWCESHWQGLDVLINNAGAGAIGPFESATTERLRQVMELDFFAPVELTRRMLPSLKRGRTPAILNIGSVLSHRAVPLKSEYCAAKFALRGWSEALRCELGPAGIDVLHLSPSTTRSEFFQSLVESPSRVNSNPFGSMAPERVARIAIASLRRSRRDYVLSLGGKGLVLANRFFPRMLDRILSRLNRPT